MIKVHTKAELKALIEERIEEFGPECDLNNVDVSEITDMSSLFDSSNFNGNISQWDVSSVRIMHYMFAESRFNGDISKWDVSSVTDMNGVFYQCQFNGDISQWNVSSVTDMDYMFAESQFNGDITQWNIDKVELGREDIQQRIKACLDQQEMQNRLIDEEDNVEQDLRLI